MWKRWILGMAMKYIQRQAKDLARELRRRQPDTDDIGDYADAIIGAFRHVLLHS